MCRRLYKTQPSPLFPVYRGEGLQNNPEEVQIVEDAEIVALFWSRSEEALAEAERKYRGYCHTVAFGILQSYEDAEECVNDALARAWNAIPPARPAVLRTFLGKITRNLSLNALEKQNAEKRGRGQIPLILSELGECFSSPDTEPERQVESKAVTQVVNSFLRGLDADKRKLFVRRYWYAAGIGEIARDFGVSESSVKSALFRLRKKLKEELEKEGVFL